MGQIPYDSKMNKMINKGVFDPKILNERTQEGLENIFKKISEV